MGQINVSKLSRLIGDTDTVFTFYSTWLSLSYCIWVFNIIL